MIGLVDGNIPPAEMQYFEELHQYMLEDEGSWALSDGFLSFIGKFKNFTTSNGELKFFWTNKEKFEKKKMKKFGEFGENLNLFNWNLRWFWQKWKSKRS